MTGIVVLNYNNYECTIACVKKILHQDVPELKVCIVDNGSANDSCEIISAEFAGNECVHLIGSKENLGFSKGNNLGIDYLRRRGCEDILVMNSDIQLEDGAVIKSLLACRGEGIGIISPIACSLGSDKVDGLFIRKKKLFFLRMAREMTRLYFIRLFSAVFRLSHEPKRREILQSECSEKLFDDRYVLSGSVFMLTSEFFRHYEGLYPRIFLYLEEWATVTLLYLAKLDSIVIDAGRVFHIGAASTDTATSLKKSKYERISSLKILRLLFLRRL